MEITHEQQQQRRREIEAKTSKRHRRHERCELAEAQREGGKRIINSVIERVRLEKEADQKRQ